MRRICIWTLLVIPVATAAGWAADAPLAASPGDTTKLVLVEDRCPTFSWSAVPKAEGYELVVYRVAQEGEEAEEMLRLSVAGSASSWTPGLDRCLERGVRYAWAVRAMGGGAVTAWSAPSLFQVAAGPSQADLQAALQVVRRYLVTEGGVEVDGVAKAKPESGMEVSGASPAPAAIGTTQLTVDGGVVATSFTGDGSTLTSLDPSNLSVGTAAIDISGNAATATNATNAATATDADTVDGAHAAALEESSEIDADILAHKNLASDHHGRYTDAEVLALIASAFSAEAACAGAGGSLDRYTDCGDGTVRDNNTGLIWLKDASCADLAGTDALGQGSWATAESAAAALSDGTCGLTDASVAGDWRQPTMSELCSGWSGSAGSCPPGAASDSLIDFSLGSAPFVQNAAGTGLWTEGDPFVGVEQSNVYWSATELNAINAWFVNLLNAGFNFFSKGNNAYIWPVRSGQ